MNSTNIDNYSSENAFTGKVALITGGATGIGAATARHLSRLGARVVITGRRADVLNDVANEIGGVAVTGDVSTEEACTRAVAAAVENYGGLDFVIANAGITREGAIDVESEDDWNQTMDINLGGVRRVALAAIPALSERPGAAIVNIASAAGLRATPNACSYVTSKTALIGLTRSMAYDLGPRGIRVNAVCPGWVATEMLEMEMSGLAKEKNLSVDETIDRCIRHYPLRRLADPIEVARVIEFLVSDKASFITGIALPVDGGGDMVDVGTLEFR
ncbi:oxidoreductase UcpA [Luminiphilus syltensis NOR5-1B]|uniref:Oxidoreductase UcpA n=1 Tax=Luminiphilus syltensis NOR5-1B TaxID=565045 RepID=B8KQR5_9GAMM|nr:SDR family oxidoreductase [Luminiphilus syltensis]EED35130.1 oxidoreductase UcpA [Luminiphilus syltensis NOR5-1B]